MFGKLFNFKKTPKNSGTEGDLEGVEGERVRVFDLELSNMEGSPTYRLTHQLTVGSEIGNIVIADESISPRHATFVLQQNVISLIDHASVTGTFVNKKQIPSGKYIILDESDEVKVGDLVLKIKPSFETVIQEISEEIAETSEEVKVEEKDGEQIEEQTEEEKLEEEEDEIEEESRPSKIKLMFEKLKSKFSFKKKPTRGKINVGVVSSSYSANALVRVVAVTMDFLFSYGLMIILLPFDDFKDLLKMIPEMIDDLLGVKLIDIWMEFTADFEAIREIANDILSAVDGVVQLWPLLFIFLSLRLISTLIFGVSFSEFLIGMKAGGNGIWARIGGVLRVFIGIITGPFLIFDVPSIVSRKTFKEFITFTQVQLRSKVFGFLGTILFLPISVAFVLIAPLFQGFEPPEQILVSEVVERRVKVQNVNPTPDGEAQASEVAVAENIAPLEVTQSSKFLNLELTYDPNSLMLSPQIKFKGVGKKLAFTPGVNFYLKDLQRLVHFEALKKFNLQKFIGIGMKGNFFLYEKFPELHAFVYRPEGEVSKALTDNTDKTRDAFAKEFMTFFKLSMDLSLENFLEVMENQTPLLQGLIEFKASFLDLIESKAYNEISFVKLGELYFLKVSYLSESPYDLLIPIDRSEGRVYKVEFDHREGLKDLTAKFYKYHLEKTNWGSPKFVEKTDLPSTFEVIDSLSSIEDVKKDFNLEKAQMLFSYFYDGSGKMLQSELISEQETWKKSLESVMKLVETLTPVAQNTEETIEEDPILKLKENFSLLKNAFESKNMEYFGLSSAESPN